MINNAILIFSLLLIISCQEDKSKPFEKKSTLTSCDSEKMEFVEQRAFSSLNAQAKIDCINNNFDYVKYVENTFQCEHYAKSRRFCFDQSNETFANCSGFFRCFSIKDE